jgi:hypothetical protein
MQSLFDSTFGSVFRDELSFYIIYIQPDKVVYQKETRRELA